MVASFSNHRNPVFRIFFFRSKLSSTLYFIVGELCMKYNLLLLLMLNVVSAMEKNSSSQKLQALQEIIVRLTESNQRQLDKTEELLEQLRPESGGEQTEYTAATTIDKKSFGTLQKKLHDGEDEATK